jgi:two-component system phosphate regulon sensor histidine kinase PhoR
MEVLLGLGTILIVALALSVWLLKRRGDRVLRNLEQVRREHAQAQRALHDLDWIAQNIEEAVFLIDRDERIVFLNRAAKNLFSAVVDRGQSFSPIAWQLQIQPLMDEILSHRAESLAQTVVKDERAFQVSVRAGPPQTTCAAIVLVSEITELQRLGRVRRDFVANISHELRTPVTTLRLLADTLSHEMDPHSPASEWIAKLQGQIDALHQLTNELMDLALIESGQMPIKLIDLAVTDLIAQVVELFRAQAERKGIALQMDVTSDLHVLADPVGARRVLGNLLHNAIKFTPTQGQVIVRARLVADNIEFQVMDNGIGIPARDVPRIFERFYRVERARMPDEVRGTGLGLAIAKHIVEGHGGRIWVESLEGKGSTFYFTLPAG